MRRLSKYAAKHTAELVICRQRHAIAGKDTEGADAVCVSRRINRTWMRVITAENGFIDWFGRNCDYSFYDDHMSHTVSEDVCDVFDGDGFFLFSDFPFKDKDTPHIYSLIINGICKICREK